MDGALRGEIDISVIMLCNAIYAAGLISKCIYIPSDKILCSNESPEKPTTYYDLTVVDFIHKHVCNKTTWNDTRRIV